IFAALVGIVAGWLTAISVMDISSYEFFKGAKMFFMDKDVILPLGKSLLFGAAVTMVACYQGFHSQGGAEGVGSAATKAAVISCLLILLLDFLMAVLILF
ncbi:MAG: ABC transporter permease, partial [Calditrichaeota bacterium]